MLLKMHSSYKAFDREGGTSAGGYVGRVILIGIPKLVIIVRVLIARSIADRHKRHIVYLYGL